MVIFTLMWAVLYSEICKMYVLTGFTHFLLPIPANSHALSVRLTHCISTLSHTIFEKVDFSCNLAHLGFPKKCFPDFPVFRKKVSWFSDFGQNYFKGNQKVHLRAEIFFPGNIFKFICIISNSMLNSFSDVLELQHFWNAILLFFRLKKPWNLSFFPSKTAYH